MVEPKVFYRELDSILAKIRIERKREDYLFTILTELEERFGSTLRFSSGHIYERRGNGYALVRSSKRSRGEIARRLPLESEAVQMVLNNGSFIYDNNELAGVFGLGVGPQGYVIPAAIYVHGPERQWLFVFELSSGWVREEISLFLNSVRMALNYRLFSEIIGTEFERAARIQQSLLPTEAPRVKGYQIAARSQPAELVGGDFYDYFQFDEESFGVSIGDASGHGFPAALLTRDVVIGLRMGLAKEMRVSHTVERLNQVMQKTIYPTNFVSMFVGEVEKDGHLFYVNAGHPPPILVSNGGVQDLVATGVPLGFVSELGLHRSYVRLTDSSVLVLYTDGILERQDAAEEQFGIEKLKELVSKHLRESAQAILDRVFEQVYEFGGLTNWEDDATVVVIKRSDE